MIALSSFLSSFVIQLPVLVVLVVGLVLLSSPGRRLPGRGHQLARAGLIVLLAQALASIAWNIAFTQLIARADLSVTQFGLASSVVGFMLAVLFAAGLGLLVGAFVAMRSFGNDG